MLNNVHKKEKIQKIPLWISSNLELTLQQAGALTTELRSPQKLPLLYLAPTHPIPTKILVRPLLGFILFFCCIFITLTISEFGQHISLLNLVIVMVFFAICPDSIFSVSWSYSPSLTVFVTIRKLCSHDIFSLFTLHSVDSHGYCNTQGLGVFTCREAQLQIDRNGWLQYYVCVLPWGERFNRLTRILNKKSRTRGRNWLPVLSIYFHVFVVLVYVQCATYKMCITFQGPFTRLIYFFEGL